MRETIVAGVVVALSGLSVARLSDRQVQAVPGPGTGIVTVQGQVDVRTLPAIEVGQRGDWRVRLADDAAVRVTSAPPVVLAAPDFLTQGRAYLVTWPDGGSERIQARELGDGGWVLTAGSSRPRWLNLSAARSIEALD